MSTTVEVKRNMVDTIFVTYKDSNPYIANTIASWKEENKNNYTSPLIKENRIHYDNCACLVCWLSRKSDNELKMLGCVYRLNVCLKHYYNSNDCQCHQELVNKNLGILNYGWFLCENKRCSYCYGMFQGQL